MRSKFRGQLFQSQGFLIAEGEDMEISILSDGDPQVDLFLLEI